ncbi:MAG: hypothetical protein OEW89_07880 [Gammaproteobacteria bacterium]|nr:hypothetical protein [Gammaproteobacteria bacterium]MDH5594664.1 hypothetical protein [Gammaproteobacteria bacterium]
MSEKKYFFDKPENIKWIIRVFYSICLLLVIADFILHRHTTMAWEEMPAFYAIYGFAAYVLLVVLSNILRKLVMRKENYYDE